MGSSIHRASSFVEPGTPVIYGRECQIDADEIIHYLHALEQPQHEPLALDLTQTLHLAALGAQPVQLQRYDQLVEMLAHT